MSSLSLGALVIVALAIFAIMTVDQQETRDFIQNTIDWIESIFHRGRDSVPLSPTQEVTSSPVSVAPPDVSVSLLVYDAYLGDNPEATFAVTNVGGPCTVDFSIFETASHEGSFYLKEDESKIVSINGPQVRNLGIPSWDALNENYQHSKNDWYLPEGQDISPDWYDAIYRTGIQITATNSSGSDSARADTDFKVVIKPFDATPYVDFIELSDARDGVQRDLREAWWQSHNVLPFLRADAYAQFVTPNSHTVKAIANELISRHPGDRELQAKEIYYWVINEISYDHASKHDLVLQATWPVETIADRTGICLNKSITLASLYESVGFDVKLITVWDSGFSDGHAFILLDLPEHQGYHQPFKDGWISLNATAGGFFGLEYPQEFDEYDIADIGPENTV